MSADLIIMMSAAVVRVLGTHFVGSADTPSLSHDANTVDCELVRLSSALVALIIGHSLESPTPARIAAMFRDRSSLDQCLLLHPSQLLA